MRKGIFLLLSLCISSGAVAAGWADICTSKPNQYCNAVGQSAYNATGTASLRKIKLGVIKGVTWRPEGSIVSISPAIPSAGIPRSVRLSPRDAFYFIVDDGVGNYFLRQCNEVQPI